MGCGFPPWGWSCRSIQRRTVLFRRPGRPGRSVQRRRMRPQSLIKDQTYGARRPRLNTCGQCTHDFSKNGFVTPSISPALGGNLLTSWDESLSCIVKYGRMSPARGIYKTKTCKFNLTKKRYCRGNKLVASGHATTKWPGLFEQEILRKQESVHITPDIPI